MGCLPQSTGILCLGQQERWGKQGKGLGEGREGVRGKEDLLSVSCLSPIDTLQKTHPEGRQVISDHQDP